MARFAVSNLHPGSVYIISIYAFNSKGRSDPAVLPAAMLRPAEKQLTAEKGETQMRFSFLSPPPLFFLFAAVYSDPRSAGTQLDTSRHAKKRTFSETEDVTFEQQWKVQLFRLASFIFYPFAIFVHDKTMAHFAENKRCLRMASKSFNFDAFTKNWGFYSNNGHSCWYFVRLGFFSCFFFLSSFLRCHVISFFELMPYFCFWNFITNSK